MSKADELFVSMCRDILDHGTTTEGEKVRPHWEDGTPAYTIKGFGVTNRYDLREEFPWLVKRLPTLWTNSYFVSTVGGAPLAIVEQYIESQKGV